LVHTKGWDRLFQPVMKARILVLSSFTGRAAECDEPQVAYSPRVADGVTIRLPEPEPTGPIKDQMYRYRGETASVGGTMDWIIRRLAEQFAGSTQPTTDRRWRDLKGRLRERGLTDRLQRQLHAVAEYFEARDLAVHAATLVVQIGESTQIFRMHYDGSTPKVKIITIEDLKGEAAKARAGYEAAQAVGRALDDDQPTVLGELNPLAKAMLIGRM
jgi:hypothetical protein